MDPIGTRHRIARWLRPLFELPAEERPDHIVLRHVSVSDRFADVATIAFGEEAGDDRLATLAEEIDTALVSDAEGLGGVQRYVAVALRGDAQMTRLPLRASAADGLADGEALDSEPATMKGLLAQLMRHNEAQARMFALSYGQVLSVMQRTIARQQAAVESAEDVRLEAVALAENLLSQRHERDLATQDIQHSVSTRQAMFQRLTDLLTLGAAHAAGGSKGAQAAGGNGAPDQPPSVPILLKGLFSSLSPEQFEELRKVLSLEQMLMVSRIIEETSGDDAGGPKTGPSGHEEPPGSGGDA